MRALTLLVMGFAAIMVAASAGHAAGFTLTSPDFADGGAIPMPQVCARYAGGNHSPTLVWAREPAGTRSFAITMFDPDAPGGGFWHWTLFDIPAAVHRLPAGAGDAGSRMLPAGAVAGRNGARQSYYLGPCPPPGAPHRYQITLYALRVARLPLAAGAPPAALEARLRRDALATARIVGLYGRPQ